MSGEATFVVWGETHAVLWGTGVYVSYMSEDDARSGFSHEETQLVTDWWSRSQALDAVFRREGLPITREMAERLDVHAWRHATKPIRIGDVTLAKLKLGGDFRTRLAWLPIRGAPSVGLVAAAKEICSGERGVEPLGAMGWSWPNAHVDRGPIAVESAEHAALLDRYTRACCEAVVARLEKEPTSDASATTPFGDADLHMVVTGAPVLVADLPRMPDALAQIEARRPRLPRPVVLEEPTLKIHVETTVWMSRDRCTEWTALASEHTRTLAPTLARELAVARKKTGVAHVGGAPMDGIQLDGGDWFRTSVYFPCEPKGRERLFEILRKTFNRTAS